ncbi:MAG: hypothetical protein JHC95_15070 [Solirubrobacteraceae bacterium]|nr:hypothetical protein [Solirubrobacteraceae bacterium]
MAGSQRVRNEIALRSVAAVSVLLVLVAGIFTGSRTEEFWVVSAAIIGAAIAGAIAMHVANVRWNPQYQHSAGRRRPVAQEDRQAP